MHGLTWGARAGHGMGGFHMFTARGGGGVCLSQGARGPRLLGGVTAELEDCKARGLRAWAVMAAEL